MLERDDALTWLSLRNVASVHLIAVDQLNTYDVLLSDDVVFTQGAYDAFVNGTAATAARRRRRAPATGSRPRQGRGPRACRRGGDRVGRR